MSRIAHEAGRLLKIETATIAGDEGKTGYPLSTGDRDYPREGVQSIHSGQLGYGDRVVMFSGGDNEYPVSIGWNPWVS